MKSNYLDGKLPLIYLLFAYGKEYNKQQYTDFAFEQLKIILAFELKRIKADNQNFDARTLDVGSAIMLFAKLGFFESDDINAFLRLFDSVAIRFMEKFSAKHYHLPSIGEILPAICYLRERISVLEVGQGYFTKINCLLHDALQGLGYCLQTQKKCDISYLLQSKTFFENCLNRKELQSVSEQGLSFVNAIEATKKDTIFQNYKQFQKNNNLVQLLRYRLFFSEFLVKNDEGLMNGIAKKTQDIMKNLYLKKTLNYDKEMQKLAVFSLFLLESPTDLNRIFLIRAMEKL